MNFLLQTIAYVMLSSEPIAQVQASMPEELAEKELQYIGERTRFSVCTGVAWFKGDQALISANLLQNFLLTYHFDAEQLHIERSTFFDNTTGIHLDKPDNLCISSDGKWMAITGGRRLNIYKIDPETAIFSPFPIAYLGKTKDGRIHGCRFSRDAKYLACVSIGDPGRICIYNVDSGFKLIQRIANPFNPLKPKGIDFSPDGNFAVICFSRNASSTPNETEGLLAIYPFDAEHGILKDHPIQKQKCSSTLEDVCFSPDGTTIFVTNQYTDTITAHTFNTQTGFLGEWHVALKNPEAKLHFPHGMGLSHNGKFLAVSNYGNDQITIYTLSNE
jgi:WD40 repeat protein